MRAICFFILFFILCLGSEAQNDSLQIGAIRAIFTSAEAFSHFVQLNDNFPIEACDSVVVFNIDNPPFSSMGLNAVKLGNCVKALTITELFFYGIDRWCVVESFEHSGKLLNIHITQRGALQNGVQCLKHQLTTTFRIKKNGKLKLKSVRIH